MGGEKDIEGRIKMQVGVNYGLQGYSVHYSDNPQTTLVDESLTGQFNGARRGFSINAGYDTPQSSFGLEWQYYNTKASGHDLRTSAGPTENTILGWGSDIKVSYGHHFLINENLQNQEIFTARGALGLKADIAELENPDNVWVSPQVTLFTPTVPYIEFGGTYRNNKNTISGDIAFPLKKRYTDDFFTEDKVEITAPKISLEYERKLGKRLSIFAKGEQSFGAELTENLDDPALNKSSGFQTQHITVGARFDLK